MVVGSLIAFVLLLAAILFLLARLWQDDALVPAVRNGPGLAAGVADSVAVQSGEQQSVAAAAVAEGRTALAVSVPAPPVGPAVGISEGLPVSAGPAAVPAEPAPEAVAEPPRSTPVAVPSPPVESEPTSTPIAVAEAGQGPRRSGTPTTPLPPRSAGLGTAGLGGAEFEIVDGGEYRLAFWFAAEAGAYLEPGSENLILRLRSDGAERPSLGLQLWEFPGEEWYGSVARGIWADGEAMGGERFLAPVADEAWHQVTVDFRASAEADGYYVVSLDGLPIDARAPLSLIAPGSAGGVVEVGLLRDEPVDPTVGLRIAGARLTETAEPTLP